MYVIGYVKRVNMVQGQQGGSLTITLAASLILLTKFPYCKAGLANSNKCHNITDVKKMLLMRLEFQIVFFLHKIRNEEIHIEDKS